MFCQAAVSWELEDLVAGVEWKEVEQEGQNPVWVENIEDISGPQQ